MEEDMEEKKNAAWWDNEYWWLTPPTAEIRAEEPPAAPAGYDLLSPCSTRFLVVVVGETLPRGRLGDLVRD